MINSSLNNGVKTRLLLIPNYLADDNPVNFIANFVTEEIHHVSHFIVENEKIARALLKKMQLASTQQQLNILIWNEHSKPDDLADIETLLTQNIDIGLITDAGLPCIADPGADIVSLAHKRGIEVIPLPGASSIFMALMASGFNGQGFTFNGYLPIDKPLRIKKIKLLEQESIKNRVTQIFMETPYRNNQLLADIVAQCNAQTKLCIACYVSSSDGFIKTKTIAGWQKSLPDLHKKPTIFILGN